MQGVVFNIQKFCINDGPGIRTNVFLKGCPMNCLWCHNPESKKLKEEISFIAAKCIGCRACEAVCPAGAHKFEAHGFEACTPTDTSDDASGQSSPSRSEPVHIFDREKCVACGKCTQVCVAEALEKIGDKMTVEEVLEEVMKDEAFYQSSGGGITLSGGEPAMQFAFALELLTEAKARGLHTCIETCGFTSKERMAKLAEVTDIFLYDWKVTDSHVHKHYTDCPNEPILENLRYIDSLGAAIILRCPIIPTVNDTEAHFAGIAALADELVHVQAIEIELYHSFGNDKLARIGRPEEAEVFPMPEPEEIEGWINRIQTLTKVPVRRA